MQPPILIISDDVEAFPTVEAAAAYLEPWAVNDDLLILDRDGQTLAAAIVTTFLSNQVVELRAVPRAAPQRERLRTALIRFVSGRRRIDPPPELNSSSIDELWRMAEPFFISV